MHRFHLLGRLDLRDAQGNAVRTVLAQPKRLAIVAYLALNEANSPCRRDTLLGIFWPELSQERARQALNKAVHFLRRALADDVLVSRSADDIAVDGSKLWCDARAFSEAANAAQMSEALELYRGDLLPGFYIEAAPAFEEWLEQERARLRRLASHTARRAADERERDGQSTAAVAFARRAAELSDQDEREVRQLLALLDRLGDRAGALYAYEKFARRLASEYDAEPAAETKTLIAHVRAREETHVDVPPAVAPRFEPYTAETLSGALRTRGYEVQRELGSGGMATVYLARDIKHDRRVALKVVSPAVGALRLADRFLAEIRVTAHLQHPNILPLLDSGEANGMLYYAMPYVEGESLRRRLEREGAIPVDEAIALIRALAAALDYAHREGVIHRDIKPDNILLQDGQPVLADFGIALALTDTSIDRLSATGLSLGTPQYMSPEQAAGDLAVGPESDIYSLAAVAYELLVGEAPFTGPTPRAVLARVMLDPPRPIRTVRSAVPAHVESAVLKALAKHPVDRFASAAEFSATLAEPDRSPAPQRPALRRSLLAVCGVAVAAVAVAVVYRPAPSSVVDQDAIAVLPFRVTSSDSSHNYLREGVLDLANALLTGDGLPRAIDTRTALRAWRQAGGAPSHELSTDQAIDVGRRLGAAHVVLGEVVVGRSGMSGSARLVRVKDARVVSEQFGVRALDERQLVTNLLGRLLALSERDAATRASSLSDSIAAVREYLAGLRQYRAGLGPGPAFERALGIDSTFAAAALWGSLAGYPSLNRRAWQLRDRMSTRDRAILAMLPQIGPNLLKPHTAEELLAAADRAARLNPDRSEVWALLGNYVFDFGASVGIQDWQRRAAWAFDSAMALDSSNARAIASRNDLALVQEDSATFNRTLRLLRRHFSDSMYFLVREREIASVIGDSPALVRLRPRLPEIVTWLREGASWNPRIMRPAIVSGSSLADAEAAVRADLNHVRADPVARSNVFQTLFAIAALRGNVERAAMWADSVTPTDSITPTVLFHVRVMTAALVDPGYDKAAAPSVRFFRALADTASSPRSVAEGKCFSELWRVRQGDTSDTRGAIARIRHAIQGTDVPIGLGAPRVGPLDVCPLFLEAQLDRGKNPRGPSPALDSLERLMRRGVGNNLPGHIADVFIARWRAEQGDLRNALEALRRRSRIRGFAWLPVYALPVPAFWREEGRLTALAGDTTSAVRAYTKYLRIRDDPSPGPMGDEVRRVREHLARLTRGSASTAAVR
jgi:serine/threonine-protein kinase